MNWTSSVRGDVYRLKEPRSAQGHEQQGERYAVVVQASAYDQLSSPHPFTHIAQTLTAVSIWVVLPTIIGIATSLRREVK